MVSLRLSIVAFVLALYLELEAKMRERANEADAIVAKLKRIASVSAEQMFTQAALTEGGAGKLFRRNRNGQPS
jgi:hypothetical protein